MGVPSVLIVDDEQKILDAVDRELFFWKTEKEVALLKALSAKEALEILREHHDSIQVLVSDLRMAAMEGDRLIEETKRLYPDIRSILITGYSESKGVSRAVSSGISAFLQKPWETETLIAGVEKAMSEFSDGARQKERMARLFSHLERTGRMQKLLYQNDSFPSTRFHVEATYRPLPEFLCGGDFYRVIHLSEDRCILILGDVSGHGLDAAFVTGIVQTLISREELANAGGDGFSPAAFLSKLNRLILRELARAPETVVNVTVAFLDRGEEKLVFANAGNLPIYLVREQSCDTHANPGYPCGFTPDAQYADLTVSIREGDRIVFMTDGLVERGRIAGTLKLEAVRALLMHFLGDPEFNRKVVDLVLEMFPDGRFQDDATLVTVTVR